MGNVFDRNPFDVETFVVYETARGTVRGTVKTSGTTHRGIFIANGGAVLSSSPSTTNTSPKLYVECEEPFLSAACVGKGVLVRDRSYDIIGWTEGRNRHNGQIQHYELTLSEVDYAS